MPGTKIVETLESIPPGASFEDYPWNKNKDFFGNGQAFFLQTPKLSYIFRAIYLSRNPFSPFRPNSVLIFKLKHNRNFTKIDKGSREGWN
jgi:hypothetical protein